MEPASDADFVVRDAASSFQTVPHAESVGRKNASRGGGTEWELDGLAYRAVQDSVAESSVPFGRGPRGCGFVFLPAPGQATAPFQELPRRRREDI